MSTYLNQLNTAYIEELQAKYDSDPQGLDPTWKSFFDGHAFANGNAEKRLAADDLAFEFKAAKFIQAYREMGHLVADVNPLDRSPKSHALLEPESFGLSAADLGREIATGEMLGDVIASLKQSYCGTATVEYSHIGDPTVRTWLEERIESQLLTTPFDAATQKRILTKLIETETFENFIHRRFVAQKRFSGEGNDAIIPMIDDLIEQAALSGCDEIVFGTAHRGRLSLLAQVFGKEIKAIFAAFAGTLETDSNPGDGDVKYHLGFTGKRQTSSGKAVDISLISNPSHLEAINPVITGIVRAKQLLKNDGDRMKTLPVLMHGDASFAGQGSIYELLNMANLKGYTVGGTIHVIINNQIGFTATPDEGRSTRSATDIAKMLEVPIFRVNADDPDAAVRCMRLALEYRNTFKQDVFIDLMGYRRYGHNEGDEPAFTQPTLYQNINQHPRVAEQYEQHLTRSNVLGRSDITKIRDACNERYEQALSVSKNGKVPRTETSFEGEWKDFVPFPLGDDFFTPTKTAVDQKRLEELGQKLLTTPAGFHLHPKIQRLLDDRREMQAGKRGIDWGFGEALAFASIIADGYRIRLSGQDSERGTFSHRHAVLHDVESNNVHIPLSQIGKPTDFEVMNSLLSEYAVMGFEFGEALADPRKMVMWEAQFGDFANGAQIIIDQFILGSAYKWQRYCGLVLLLPHGYEGQGPEHSSARVERFLQGAAQHNIQVCSATTPAQYFHLLRRQMLRNYRLPLVVLTPKSFLRNPKAISTYADFATGTFQEILNETNADGFKKSKRVILCSGKIYYELLAARENLKKEVPLIRVEQFYPFAGHTLATILKFYPKAEKIVWCQEEPQNMGAYTFVKDRIATILERSLELAYVGRPAQANVSGGYAHVHEIEQKRIVEEALS
ncbi:MAG: 2-oxoglutarate dehydrogenase E1 component [Deltaproteobacteria bacterium]|nr:2-oxoglutarate dehydrogenase E1 component [Deltaproteobacteria bacterium]